MRLRTDANAYRLMERTAANADAGDGNEHGVCRREDSAKVGPLALTCARGCVPRALPWARQ